jgi:hypothetical protein
MLGFKRFTSATIVVAGIELMQRIRKGQFNLAKLGPQELRCARNLECGPFNSVG